MENKETLEEAAENYAESNQYDLEYYDEDGYQGIEVKAFAEKLVDFTAKWQAWRMYSEEEVEIILKSYKEFIVKELKGLSSFKDKNHWFEQFKKK